MSGFGRQVERVGADKQGCFCFTCCMYRNWTEWVHGDGVYILSMYIYVSSLEQETMLNTLGSTFHYRAHRPARARVPRPGVTVDC